MIQYVGSTNVFSKEKDRWGFDDFYLVSRSNEECDNKESPIVDNKLHISTFIRILDKYISKE